MKLLSIVSASLILSAVSFAEERNSEFGVEVKPTESANEQVMEKENEITSQFYDELAVVEAKYRVSKAELIKKADRVEVFLVSFDSKVSNDPFSDGVELEEGEESVNQSKALQKKVLKEENRAAFLKVLADTIAVPKHYGGAFCHFPIHGVKVYAGDLLLHEGTFCWKCGNFTFNYPQGSAFLDTNAELQKLFTTVLPIPQSELDRFYKKYPSLRPKKKVSEAP